MRGDAFSGRTPGGPPGDPRGTRGGSVNRSLRASLCRIAKNPKSKSLFSLKKKSPSGEFFFRRGYRDFIGSDFFFSDQAKISIMDDISQFKEGNEQCCKPSASAHASISRKSA